MAEHLKIIGKQLLFRDKIYRCSIGKSKFSTDKHEGDGCTPLGIFALRECWYRPDRVAPPLTQLPLHAIQHDDGWSDDPKSGDYNRHIKLTNPPPQGGRGYENLWREDHVYDIIVPLGYNDDPIIPGKGSAIFMHLAKDDYAPTEGCVALKKADMLEILFWLGPESCIDIQAC